LLAQENTQAGPVENCEQFDHPMGAVNLIKVAISKPFETVKAIVAPRRTATELTNTTPPTKRGPAPAP